MKVLTILCQKGGVGKTTFVVNLGKLLSHKGHKTLLIDTDPQGNVSTYLNFDKNSKEASLEFLSKFRYVDTFP